MASPCRNSGATPPRHTEGVSNLVNVMHRASLIVLSSALAISCSSGSGSGAEGAPADAAVDGASSSADDVATDLTVDPSADAADTGAATSPTLPDDRPEPIESVGPAPTDALTLEAIGPEGACGTPVRNADAPLLRWPYLQSAFPDTVRVAWTSPSEGRGVVRYAPLGEDAWREVPAFTEAFPTERTGADQDYIAYDATLSFLQPGQTVCYEVWLDETLLVANASLQSAWTTHERPLRILAVGDSGTGGAEQYALKDRMLELEADIFLHLGDMAYGDGTYVEFENNMFAVYDELLHAMPMWPAIGNHEYRTNLGRPYLDVYYLPEQTYLEVDREYYYSFDYGNVHFVSIDSNDPRFISTVFEPEQGMLAWLEDDLAATDAEWIIAFMHHPAYSASERDPNVAVRNQLIPIFESHGVDLVLAGHDHHYERSVPILGGAEAEGDDAITYIVSGAGGAGLRTVLDRWWTEAIYNQRHSALHLTIDGCIATGRVIDDVGAEVDRFELNGCD